MLVQYLDELAVAGMWDGWKRFIARNDLIRYEGGWRGEPSQPAWDALMFALVDLAALDILEEESRRGLDVRTACAVLRGLPSGTGTCQVTLFLDEIHWATNPCIGLVDLQLDMSRHHWIMLPRVDDEPVNHPDVDDRQLDCYGNGPSLPAGAPRACASRPRRALA